MTEHRRFPGPWRVVELQESFRVEDASGFGLAYTYFTDDPERRSTTKRMSREDARKMAQAFAMMPDLREPLREAMGLRLA
jgi:hypothetical protein